MASVLSNRQNYTIRVHTKHCSTVPLWFLPWGVDLVKQAQLDKKLELALMNESAYNVLYINIALDYRAVGRRSGGAMVLGKLPVPGRPTIWITVGQGPTALAVGAGGGCLDILLSSILSLLFLPLFGSRSDIDRNTVSKGR